MWQWEEWISKDPVASPARLETWMIIINYEPMLNHFSEKWGQKETITLCFAWLTPNAWHRHGYVQEVRDLKPCGLSINLNLLLYEKGGPTSHHSPVAPATVLRRLQLACTKVLVLQDPCCWLVLTEPTSALIGSQWLQKMHRESPMTVV